ncbi:hypothetical protein ABK040_000139 [Willaertia magna]
MLSRRVLRSLAKGNKNSTLSLLGNNLFNNQRFNASSYLKGEQTQAIDNTIGYVLSKNARTSPYANALKCSFQDVNWNYATLKKHVEALACGLIEMGVRPGDRLALIQGMTAETFVTLLACAKIGAILSPIPEVKTAKDLTRFIELLRPRVIITSTKIGNRNYFKMIKEVVPELSLSDLHLPFKSKKFPYCKQILFTDNREKPKDGTYQLRDVLVYGPFGYYETPLRRIAMQLEPTNPGLVLFNDKNPEKATSTIYTHKNLLNAGNLVAKELGLQHGERVMIPKYSTTPSGAILGNFTAFVTGGVVVYPSEEFNTATTLSQLSLENCSTLFVESQELEDLLNHADLGKHTFDSLKNIVICVPLGVDTTATIATVKQKLPNVKVTVVSGLEETSGILTVNGKVVDNTEVKVVDGTLHVKGTTVAAGKWQDIGQVGYDINEDGWVNTKNTKVKIEGEKLVLA